MAYSPADLVTMAWNKGMAKSDEWISNTQGYFDTAIGRAGASASMAPAYLNFTPNVVEPDVQIPKLADGASLEMFDQWWNRMIDILSDKYGTFLTKYFPNDGDYLKAAEQWICNAIKNGGTGIKPAVEAQIWERDRARILRDAARAEREVVTSYAARGWPMPPGAMQASLANVQADTRDKIAQASRDVAIQQAQMEVENVRFAVQQALSLYSSAMGAARDFIAALAGTAGVSGQLIPSVTDSQSRLITAASSYYQSRIAVQELKLKAVQPNSDYQQQANMQNLQAQMQTVKNMVDAAIAAANALATDTAAMLNALHVSTSTDARSSTSVGYNYSGEVSGDVSPITSI